MFPLHEVKLMLLLEVAMPVKRNGSPGFSVTFWDLWAYVFTKNGGYLACFRDWIPS